VNQSPTQGNVLQLTMKDVVLLVQYGSRREL
jgi:hypothetical protein